MVVTDQINALRALGTDPIRKLVVPRMLAGIFMAPVLTVIADFVGIVGGWIVARFQLQVATGLYWSSILEALYMQDVWMGLIKPFVLGLRDRDDRLPRRAADDRRHAGRRQGDDEGGGRRIGRRHRGGLLHDARPDFADCIEADATIGFEPELVDHAEAQRASSEPEGARSSCSTTSRWRSTTRSC